MPSSLSLYFPTILCNSRHFKRTTVNHGLQYAIFDGKNEPRPLEIGDFDDLVKSGAAFATTFFPNDPVLDDIDQELLGRSPGKPVPGGWCLGDPKNDTCAVWGNADILRPGPGSRRLEKCIVALLSNGTFQSQQCVVD